MDACSHAARACLELASLSRGAHCAWRLRGPCCAGLAERERLNPQFSFLKETHSLFGFFTALCDAYSSALMPPKDLTTRLHSDASDMCAAHTAPVTGPGSDAEMWSRALTRVVEAGALGGAGRFCNATAVSPHLLCSAAWNGSVELSDS